MADGADDGGPDVRPYVGEMLRRAVRARASDIHLEPVAGGLEVRFRVDGLLERVEQLPADVGRSAVLRLMVMAQLLTYRLDIPQEGRIRMEGAVGAHGVEAVGLNCGGPMDLRLAVIPVAFGLRAVVRLPAESVGAGRVGLEELGLSAGAVELLRGFAKSDAGMLLVTGPAGAGKTTTIYALLEHVAREQPGVSIIALEDPIERIVSGVTQIEVTPHGQMTYERALQSILRQDPQVLMLGEVRSAVTASVAVQAALSGHRLIATMHAGDPATAIARLIDMGIEPYQVTSSVHGVLTQRLVRRRSDDGAGGSYKGRVALAEWARMNAGLREAVLRRGDAAALRAAIGGQAGHETLRESGEKLVRAGATDAAELVRVLGEA